MKYTSRILVLAFLLSLALPDAFARKKKKDEKPPLSEYAVLTGSDSVSLHGVMNVIEKDDSFFLELPTSLLGREFLVVNKLQEVPRELNESGVNRGIVYQHQTVRFQWDRKRGEIIIRQQRPTPLANGDEAVALSVRENYLDPVLAVLKVRAVGTSRNAGKVDSVSVVFPVDKLFNGTENCINDVFSNINIPNSPHADLSRILSIKSHPDNVTALSELTTVVTEGTDRVNVSVVVSSSLCLLAEKPMEGREECPRIGFFSEDLLAYSDTQQEVETRHFINRWQLVPRDREAYLRGELVEPLRPIVFWLDKRIPENLAPYIKKGIEDWNVAFEKAGFKSAVQVRFMTDSIEREDDDMHYSTLDYDASEKSNAMGPAVVDPRSGEILEADIIWWHNVRKLLATWIMVQTGASNPDVRSCRLPDALIGDAARFVASHEVGHSLGLRHNMRASSAYPTDSLRSKTFTDRVGGTSPSIMDYARFNYVAQPGDGVTQFSPHIGPYDLLAIEWGYRWFPSEAEGKEKLARLLASHQGEEYKYAENTEHRQTIDPRSQSEDLGDNSIKSALLGIANLKRLMPRIQQLTRTGEPLQTWDDAARLWNSIIAQWDLYNYQVLANVGGIYLENTSMGDGQKTFQYVEKARQKGAVQFLIDQVFTYPAWLFSPALADYTYIVKNGEENHPSTSLRSEQNFLLWDLLANERLMRMLQNEAEQGKDKAFTAQEMLSMLLKAVFTDHPLPDMNQRSMQKSLVDALITASEKSEGIKLNKSLALGEWCCADSRSLTSKPRKLSFTNKQMTRTSDVLSLKRACLMHIRQFAQTRIGTNSTAQQMHYSDIVQRIDTALKN